MNGDGETMEDKVAFEAQAALVRADTREAILDNVSFDELYDEIYTERAVDSEVPKEELLDFIEQHMPDVWHGLVKKWGR